MGKISIIKVIVIIVLIGAIIFYYQNKEYIDILNQNGKFEYQIFSSPDTNNKLTLFVHTDGAFGDKTYIYVIDGEYTKKVLPKEKYIKFPDDTGVSFHWDNNSKCTVISDKPCVVNKIDQKSRVNLVVDRNLIREQLTKEGKVYRYSIKPFMPDND